MKKLIKICQITFYYRDQSTLIEKFIKQKLLHDTVQTREYYKEKRWIFFLLFDIFFKFFIWFRCNKYLFRNELLIIGNLLLFNEFKFDSIALFIDKNISGINIEYNLYH